MYSPPICPAVATRTSYMQCVTMRDVNEGLMANMIADGDDLRRIYETLAVLSKKVDLIFEMMKVEQEQRLAAMKAQSPSSPSPIDARSAGGV